jgi:two-component system cell cycle sensor histidine kinase/response regulator CckA
LAVSTVLRRAGLDVLEAEDGQAALDLFEQKGDGIDVVVTDAVMPRMGGEELVEKISAQAPEVPCLVCSGYAADMFSERFFSSPLRAFLAKPFSNRELLTMLAALLNDGNVAAPLPPADGHTRCPDSPR